MYGRITGRTRVTIETMTTKQQVLKAINALPEEASVEDAMEQLYFLLKIRRGLDDLDAGRVTSHEEVRERFLGELAEGD